MPCCGYRAHTCKHARSGEPRLRVTRTPALQGPCYSCKGKGSTGVIGAKAVPSAQPVKAEQLLRSLNKLVQRSCGMCFSETRLEPITPAAGAMQGSLTSAAGCRVCARPALQAGLRLSPVQPACSMSSLAWTAGPCTCRWCGSQASVAAACQQAHDQSGLVCRRVCRRMLSVGSGAGLQVYMLVQCSLQSPAAGSTVLHAMQRAHLHDNDMPGKASACAEIAAL